MDIFAEEIIDDSNYEMIKKQYGKIKSSKNISDLKLFYNLVTVAIMLALVAELYCQLNQ